MIEVIPKIESKKNSNRTFYDFENKKLFLFGYDHYYNFYTFEDATITS